MRLFAVYAGGWKGKPTLQSVEVLRETATAYWTGSSDLAFGCRRRHEKTTPQTPEAAWSLYRQKLEAVIVAARETIRRAETNLAKIPGGEVAG